MGRTAEEDLGSRLRGGQPLLDHVRVNESNSAVPLLRRGVEDVVDFELLRVGLGERVELSLEENVGEGDVGVDERDLGVVLGVLECCSDNLLHPLASVRGNMEGEG